MNLLDKADKLAKLKKLKGDLIKDKKPVPNELETTIQEVEQEVRNAIATPAPK